MDDYLTLLHTAQQMENDSISTYLKAIAVAPPEDIPDLIEITTDENDHSCIIRKIVTRLEG
jgi:rubrerythrin